MKGLGTDIIEVGRIEEALEEFGAHFIEKHFTSKEILYCNSYNKPAERFAGRFAAKEAIVKALGTGFAGIGFLDIEILNKPGGAPHATIKLPSYSHLNILISISHCRSFATATALVI
ncbi:MAG: holo-ACP synthase [Chlamydiia bacterium]